MDRRSFIGRTGFAVAATSTVGGLTACSTTPGPHIGAAGIGICDWNLGPMCDPEQIPKAREANLEGIQVSVGRDPEQILLRDPAVRQRYLELGRQHEITFHSIAAGGLLNSFPLATDPRSAVWVIEAIEAAAALGASNVLMAFFSNGDLRYRDSNGEFVNQSEDGFASYQLDEENVASVVNTLKEIVPRAQDAGVVLGLENTITAAQNLAIIDQVSSEWLQIYYDVGNSTGNGYDVPGELIRIGSDRLCEVHLKDWNTPLLGGEDGMVDMTAAAAALNDIGYDKWLVLETSGRDDRFLDDTRANVAWAKQTFDRT